MRVSSRDSLPLRQDSIPDSLNVVTGIAGGTDSIVVRPLLYLLWEPVPDTPFFIQAWKRHPFFDFNSQPVIIRADWRKTEGKEWMFYVLTGMLLLFALLRQLFAKYFQDLFRVFFRTSLKQKQIREQLMQNQLPSLLLNVFFIATAGLYINFLLYRYGSAPINDFWLLYLYCCAGLCLIYIGKYIALRMAGWLFSMKEGAASYIFIVFIVNKIIGIFLLPVLALLAFAEDPLYSISLVLSWCGIAGLLLYRFVLGYAAIRNEIRFNLFHFFLYLCAFEVAPLLVLYKLSIVVFR